MRVRSEKCEGRGGGGEGGGGIRYFFFPTSKFLPRFCRHIVGVPFVHHKPLTRKKKKLAWDISISAWERENVVKCVSLTLNAWELAAPVYTDINMHTHNMHSFTLTLTQTHTQGVLHVQPFSGLASQPASNFKRPPLKKSCVCPCTHTHLQLHKHFPWIIINEPTYISCEPEGPYHYSKMFLWGRYRHKHCTLKVPFWFSTEHLWILIVPFWLWTGRYVHLMAIYLTRLQWL